MGRFPLIAIQLKAVEVGDLLTLIATRVVDLFVMGRDEEDEGETVDRASWERAASPNSLKTMDALVQLIKGVDPAIAPKYNKYYIGLTSAGATRNFVVFRPRKGNVPTEFKIPQEDELTERLEESGLAIMSYDSRVGAYRIQRRFRYSARAFTGLTKIVINSTDFVIAICSWITIEQIPVVDEPWSLFVVWVIPSVAPPATRVAGSAYCVAQ